MAGVIDISESGNRGDVSIGLPNGERCTGSYTSQTRTEGIWSVGCSLNGLTAKGTFIARGDGKGSEGSGADSQGRKLSYVVGVRSP